MTDFWGSDVWGSLSLIAVLFTALLLGNLIKKNIPWLKKSLIPTSVIGGLILFILSNVYRAFAGKLLFETEFFGENGMSMLEILTYHALALGFIATMFKPDREKFTKERAAEVFNTGVTTVSSYLLQAILGLGITLLYACVKTDFFSGAGVLLCFGYGQGTGQALNYGILYETEYGFAGGRSFGLTLAAAGFLSASFGGIIRLAFLKKKYGIERQKHRHETITLEQIQTPDEIPMSGSIDKMTMQVGIVLATYLLTYLSMFALGALVPSLKSVIYGFNFLFGALFAALVLAVLKFLRKRNIVKHEYINPFLMKRIGGVCFDVMIVAGIAAIRIELFAEYWFVLLLLAVVGAVSTYFYNLFVAKVLFPAYAEEQFLAMYGMLTGTAGSGMMLLREIDNGFETPVADNLVYQNFPAIVFGFPLMLLATLAPKEPLLTLGIVVPFFLVLNVILFRSKIFKKRK